MVCKECDSKMRLDGENFRFDGDYDDFWSCSNCKLSCVERVRYGKTLVEDWCLDRGSIIWRKKIVFKNVEKELKKMLEMREKVRLLLKQYHLTNMWLTFELEKVGLSIDGSTISQILTGVRKSPQAKEVIERSFEILERYEKLYVKAI